MKEDIQNQIKKAISAHGLWKVRLKKAINTRSSEFEVENVRSPHLCEFGKWLDAEKPKLVAYPFYEKVCQLHAQVHEETARVMRLALGGKKEEASKAIALGSHFSTISAHLTQQMVNWKNSV